MIGYYVHHHGRGHLHRALAVAEHVTVPLVGLSSLPRPLGWEGEWIELPDDATDSPTGDVEAHGRLHWVPEHHRGLRSRMGEISSWIVDLDPDLMVVDVSVEVTMLARLHGVPAMVVGQPGDRSDPAHDLAYGVARRILGAWPEEAGRLLRTTGAHVELTPVGAFSRFDGRERPAPIAETSERRRVVLMSGAGGSDLDDADVEAAIAQTPSWDWTVLGTSPQTWIEDPWDELCRADVVVTHAGQNALAEVAAARTPAVVIPQVRPFLEQHTTAAALRHLADGPAIVRHAFPTDGWDQLLESAAALDGDRWQLWNDGRGAQRAAALIEETAAVRHGPAHARPA